MQTLEKITLLITGAGSKSSFKVKPELVDILVKLLETLMEGQACKLRRSRWERRIGQGAQ